MFRKSILESLNIINCKDIFDHSFFKTKKYHKITMKTFDNCYKLLSKCADSWNVNEAAMKK